MVTPGLSGAQGLLHQCNSAAARYLFQQDKFYDVSWDTGDKSVQCGRKVDAFKLWLLWKARGDRGLAALVDNAMDCARFEFDAMSTASRGEACHAFTPYSHSSVF